MKVLPLIIVALCISSFSQGQILNEEFREKLSIGLKAGVNISNVYDSHGEDFEADPKAGAAAGVFMQIPVGAYLGFHPEVLFSQKGFYASGSFIGHHYSFTRTTNHIDVPLLIAFKPAGFLTILGGPNYSFMFSQRDNFNTPLLDLEQEQEFDDVNLRRNTLGFIGGLDFNMMNFVLGTRVAWDFQSNHGDGSSSIPRYRNTWFQFSLGFRF